MTSSFTADEVRAIVAATSGDFAGATLAEHATAAFATLERVIPHTSLNAFVINRGIPAPLCTTGLIDERGLRDYVGHYIQTDPMRSEFGNLASRSATLFECARRVGVNLRKNEFLQDYAIPRYRIGDLLGSNTLIGEETTFTFALHREPIMSRFGERDQLALQIVLEPLTRALRVTHARERARELLARGPVDAAVAAVESVGVAVLDESLDVVNISSGARQIFRALDGAGALDELFSLARACIHELRLTADQTSKHAASATRVAQECVAFRIVATRFRAGAPIIAYVFVERAPSRAQLVVARASERYKLTPREIEVTALHLEGATLAAIARRLELRPQSVRAAFLKIRKKLGVRTNAEILHRLLVEG